MSAALAAGGELHRAGGQDARERHDSAVLSQWPDDDAHVLDLTCAELLLDLIGVGGDGGAASVGREPAVVTETGIGRVIQFDTTKLPILPKGEFYELWFVGPGDSPGRPNRISAGTFHPDKQGRSKVTFAAAVDPAKYPVLSVTAEPGDGDPSPSGPDILRSTAPA